MKLLKNRLIMLFVIFFLTASAVQGGFEYKSFRAHKGGDITPLEAYRIQKENPKNTFLVDVRTRAEYQFVGHAEGAFNIPFMFLSNDAGQRGYNLVPNTDFIKELKALFNTETDTLLIYCKGGGRSMMAAEAAVKAGFDEARVFNILGGFEGDINNNKESIYHGKPFYGGWIREGLPWTYDMNPILMYQPDIKVKNNN